RTLPITTAVSAIQAPSAISTRSLPNLYFILTPAPVNSAAVGAGWRGLQGNPRIECHIHQIHQDQRGKSPDAIAFVAVAGYIPAAPFIVDPVGHFPVVLEEIAQRHAEDFLDLILIGAQIEDIRDYADIGRDLDAEARDQTAQRPYDLDQGGQQTDCLMRFTQGGVGQIHVGRITPTARQCHLTGVGRQVVRAQGKNDFRFFINTGHRYQYTCFWQASRIHYPRLIPRNPRAYLVEHASYLVLFLNHGMISPNGATTSLS